MNHLHDGTGHDLTPREREVAWLIARGYTNPQIANELTITHETVKSHVSNILSKLCVDSRSDVRNVIARSVVGDEAISEKGEP